jgi:hypothetical protein
MSDPDTSDLLQTARCEDLLYEQINEVSVVGDFERRIIDATKGSGANLLEGARGVGKSMLLRIAEFELDRDFERDRKLGVYVNFKTSTLLEGVKADERDSRGTSRKTARLRPDREERQSRSIFPCIRRLVGGRDKGLTGRENSSPAKAGVQPRSSIDYRPDRQRVSGESARHHFLD